MLRVSKVRLDYERLPDGDAKKTLLRAIERAGNVLPLNAALRIARLSSSRYHGWCRAEDGCELDNYSRRILSWTLEDRLGSGGTCRILRDAAVQLRDRFEETTVVADSGSENVNREVDAILVEQELTRVLAQVEVTFSNSMIEAFWRSLKHSWLFLHALDNFTALGRLIEFYVEAHNTVMPHSAFKGQTPDEMYFGTGRAVPAELATARENARK
jgi:putative transposase